MFNNASSIKITDTARAIAEGNAIYHIFRHHDKTRANEFLKKELGNIKGALNTAITLQDLRQIKLHYQNRIIDNVELAAIQVAYIENYFNSCCRAMGALPGLVRAEPGEQRKYAR